MTFVRGYAAGIGVVFLILSWTLIYNDAPGHEWLPSLTMAVLLLTIGMWPEWMGDDD